MPDVLGRGSTQVLWHPRILSSYFSRPHASLLCSLFQELVDETQYWLSHSVSCCTSGSAKVIASLNAKIRATNLQNLPLFSKNDVISRAYNVSLVRDDDEGPSVLDRDVPNGREGYTLILDRGKRAVVLSVCGLQAIGDLSAHLWDANDIVELHEKYKVNGKTLRDAQVRSAPSRSGPDPCRLWRPTRLVWHASVL